MNADLPEGCPEWLAQRTLEFLEATVDTPIGVVLGDRVAVAFEGDHRGLLIPRRGVLATVREKNVPGDIVSVLTAPAPQGTLFILGFGSDAGVYLGLIHVAAAMGMRGAA